MSLTPVMEADSSSILEMGRRAIATEAEALWALANIDDAFVSAVHLIRQTTGRLLVCGAGRSANIGSKLAATFAATGTPSHFLHVDDALHGGLGVMQPGDALLILSRSGEARGGGIIMRWARARSIPIVAITANTASLAARMSDVHLLLPPQPEICPFGTTPTTSATMMLALGDAIAMTLVRVKKLKAIDLRHRVPGHSGGLDLLIVDDFMREGDELPLVSLGASFETVLHVMNAKRFGVAGIIGDDRRLLGIITDGVIREHARKLDRVRPEDIMIERPRTLTCGAKAREALATMSQSRISTVFVLGDDDGPVQGLVHIQDLLRLGIG